MSHVPSTALLEAISRQRPGWSLEQPFYTSGEIYEVERQGWLAKQWYVLGHCSEIPDVGSHMVRDLLGESLVIVRADDGRVRGFFNVCRHRGSRVCTEDGKSRTLVCPYHAWSYRLDGSLRSASAMPDGIDLSTLSLKPVPVVEVAGVILCSLRADPASLEPMRTAAEPMLRYHGMPTARIAARRSYPTRANWKLVMENFAECYHCYPSHPEYCSVMGHVAVLARQATSEASARWEAETARWFKEEADPDSPAGSQAFPHPASEFVSRAPVGGGRKTQSQDGKPVAPLMGELRRFDGGFGIVKLRPFVPIILLNDHALLFQFLPKGPEATDVYITWLVDGSAKEADVDVERMMWLWDTTTRQDKKIVELNAAGVRSSAYSPGPYSKLEEGTALFVKDYLDQLAESCRSH
jgi:Rieske 2Fe-2S family protein